MRPVSIWPPWRKSTPRPCATPLTRVASPGPWIVSGWNADSCALKPTVSALARLCATSDCARIICVAPVMATYSERSMGCSDSLAVIPAKAGIQRLNGHGSHWIPAYRRDDLTLRVRSLRMLMMVWVSWLSVEITCAFAW
ncbi:hypothetical protein RLIN73S_04884 [Rhodanobacter lindaniclasticus]